MGGTSRVAVVLGVCAVMFSGCGDDGTGGGTAGATDSAGTTAGPDTAVPTTGTGAGMLTEAGSATDGQTGTVGPTTTTTSDPTTGSPTSDPTSDPTTDVSTGTTVGVSDGSTSTTSDETTSTPDTSTGEQGPCMSSGDCADGEVCAAGVCVPGEGPCDESGDCHGDTFCCEDGCLPPGESPGSCIPWGLEPEGLADPMCEGEVIIGLFTAEQQCEWLGPPPNDPFPNHVNVLTTPLVADLPNGGGGAKTTEMIIVTYNYTDGGIESGYGSNPNYFGVIRIIDGRTCELRETIHDPNNRIIAASTPAIADLDNDGDLEIVTHRASSGVIAFRWNENLKKYGTYWVALDTGVANLIRWDGPSIHDLDNDSLPEVISGSAVFSGATGLRLNPGQILNGASPNIPQGVINVLGDLDGDGAVDLVAGSVHRWDVGMSQWTLAYTGAPANRHYGYADFGTPGMTPADFDPTTLDGIAEIVSVGGNLVRLHTLSGQLLLTGAVSSGGPPTIGDFDGDGRPEIASAGGTAYVVYDLDCKNAGPGCVGNYVRWTRPSQDASSATTASTIFDFEGDGKDEAVYGDECFIRVYAGATGEVLYSSYRTSCTWYENPVVADMDNDSNTEIIVGSNANCNVVCPQIDPIHRGIPCETAEDCQSGTCDAGLCRCAATMECEAGHVCAAPPAMTPGNGNTCRAEHPPGAKKTGVRVLKDKLDRWASSRAIWNQHSYNITNLVRVS